MPGWIGTGLSLVSWVLGLLGYGKKDPVASAQATGEKLGKLEAENAALKDFIDAEKRVGDAAATLDTSPGGVWNDPANRNNPTRRRSQ